ncbi:MAG: VWA domain-containing protein [Flavobacteriaceae bacterium]|nr:VWA domain-containing protein [Flavobacteriaceae bacterium]
MHENALLYIILAAFIALAVAGYFYGYKSKLNLRLRWFFGTLRFLTIFVLLLLLINPKFYQTTYFNIKPTLAVVVDNSHSVSYLDKNNEAEALLEFLKNNDELNNKFDLSFYAFGESLKRLDTLTFSERQTNISDPLLSLNEIYKNKVAPVLLVTDGNQTLGTDFEFSTQNTKQSIYSVILGDTVTYKDFAITQINVNRYAYLRNEFPVEVFLLYTGDTSENTTFTIKQGNSTVFQQALTFNAQESSKVIDFKLPANSVGVQKYTAAISALENEKNTDNNTKFFAVEVIDQATNVLLVSDITHPDLGALKKSISSNEQRKLTLKTPEEAIENLEDSQLVILYQPTNRFNTVFDRLQQNNQNTLLITGKNTNWTFLNARQNKYSKAAYSSEQVQARLNSGFALFSIEDIGFNGFPPLETSLGDLKVNVPHDVLLSQRILGIDTENPLLFTFEENNRKMAILDGENIWKWRSHVYVRNKSFKPFDDFVSSLIQYLSSDKLRTRLDVKAESFYYNSGDVKLSAQYFDQNYIFNNKASITITVKNRETEQENTFPLLLKSNFYEVNLSSLPAGEYSYTVSVTDEALSSSGNFSIIDFNVEQQFLNANVDKLQRVSIATGGVSYFVNDYSNLISDLVMDDRYVSIQKSEQKIVTLLNWKILLFILAFLLALEWFSRKYNGLT